jgi:hypothetical protein
MLRPSISKVHTIVFGGLLVAISALVLSQGTAKADNTGYIITMSPSSTELSANPGASTNSTFAAVNEGTAGYTLGLSVAPYHVAGVNYDPEFNVLPGKTDASKWLHLNTASGQILGPGKAQTISYSLNVPAGTAPGGYYAVIFASAIPPTNNGVTAINRVGDIIYITVNGPVKKTGDLKSVGLPYVSFAKKLSMGALVQDTGGVHFITNVNVKVKSIFGHVAYNANLQRYVLPQTERLVSTTWTNVPLFGIYEVSRSATVFGKTLQLPNHWLVIISPVLLICIILGIALIVAAIFMLRSSHKSTPPETPQVKPDVQP